MKNETKWLDGIETRELQEKGAHWVKLGDVVIAYERKIKEDDRKGKLLVGFLAVLIGLAVFSAWMSGREWCKAKMRALSHEQYVAHDGNDANDGSKEHPKATVQAAMNALENGSKDVAGVGTVKIDGNVNRGPDVVRVPRDCGRSVFCIGVSEKDFFRKDYRGWFVCGLRVAEDAKEIIGVTDKNCEDKMPMPFPGVRMD